MGDLNAITRMEKIIAGEDIKPETRLEIFLKEYSSGGGESYKYVTGTLTAGSTSITLSDASITTDATYDIYTTVYGVNPTDVSLVAGSITMTFDVQQSDIGVKIRIYDPVPANVVSISATYEQSGTVYTYTPLDYLKTDLTVTATYDNGVTIPVTDYELSGTLEIGTSTITVTYEEKTDTFDVTVSESSQGTIVYEWDFTESMYDKKQNKQADGSNITQNSQGVSNDTLQGYLRLVDIGDLTDKTIEIDVKNITKDSTPAVYLFSLLFATGSNESFLGYNSSYGWRTFRDNVQQNKDYSSDQTSFSNCTFKFIFTEGHVAVLIDDVLFYEGGTFASEYNTYNTFFVNNNSQPYGMFTVTGARVYQNV